MKKKHSEGVRIIWALFFTNTRDFRAVKYFAVDF
jgi:hypothetical protein